MSIATEKTLILLLYKLPNPIDTNLLHTLCTLPKSLTKNDKTRSNATDHHHQRLFYKNQITKKITTLSILIIKISNKTENPDRENVYLERTRIASTKSWIPHLYIIIKKVELSNWKRQRSCFVGRWESRFVYRERWRQKIYKNASCDSSSSSSFERRNETREAMNLNRRFLWDPTCIFF